MKVAQVSASEKIFIGVGLLYFGRGAKPKLLFSGKIIVSDEKTSFCEFFAEVACRECVVTENERKIIVTNVSGLCLRERGDEDGLLTMSHVASGSFSTRLNVRLIMFLDLLSLNRSRADDVRLLFFGGEGKTVSAVPAEFYSTTCGFQAATHRLGNLRSRDKEISSSEG